MACGRKQRQNKPFIMSLITVLVGIGALTFVAVVNSTTKSSGRLFETVKDAVCVSCALLENHAPDVKPLLQALMETVEEGNVRKCCVQNLQTLRALLELVSERGPVSDFPVFKKFDDVPKNEVAAHKSLHPSRYYERENVTDTWIMVPLGLTPEDDNSELSSNVLVTPHGIIILHTGLYRVYVSIKFRRHSSDRPCGYRNVTTWHYGVVRSRPNDRQQSGNILYAPHTCCKNCSTEHETSYTAGLFILQASDHLHVEVSTPEVVQFDETSTFFGLTMLGRSAPW